MADEIVRRNSLITAVSLLIFFIFSFFATSYYNKQSLEKQLVNYSKIVNAAMMKTNTEEELYKVVDDFTVDQEWLGIIVANSNGSILCDSSDDAVGVTISMSLEASELTALNNSSNDSVYLKDNYIYHIWKINDDIIVRTSVKYEENMVSIYTSIFIIIILLIVSLFICLLSSKNTSKRIINTLEDIGNHLKTINDGEYNEISDEYKYPEVKSVLKEINIINNNIVNNISTIKHEHDKLQYLIDNLTQGILIIDENDNIVLVNDYALKYLDIYNFNVVSTKYKDVMNDDKFLNKMEEIKINKNSSYFDLEVKDKILATSINHLKNKWYDPKKEIDLYVVIVSDVTEERNNEHMKAEFIANASHELKTPITSIRGFAELLLMGEEELDEDTKKYLNIILTESIKMKETIDELLYLANLDKAKNDPIKQVECYFKDIVEDVMEAYVDLSEKNNVSITNDVDSDVFIMGQPTLLYHLIANLVENGIRYNKPNGNVNIGVKEVNEEIILTVSDNGIGIDEKNLPKIFERFYRVDESRNSGGTGIGLNIVKQLCNIFDAEISVESVINEGTIFTIKFKK